jgi:hypothetical protein
MEAQLTFPSASPLDTPFKELFRLSPIIIHHPNGISREFHALEMRMLLIFRTESFPAHFLSVGR